MSRFDDCLAFVLAREGGFSDDPADHGGATLKGITQRVYDKYRDEMKLPRRSVRGMQDKEMREIYQEDYWYPMHCPNLPMPLDLIMFDSAVNHGVGGATQLLQRVLGVKVDGSFGPVTLRAATNFLADKVAHQRRAYYAEIIANDPTQKRFEAGWNNRMVALEKAAGLA